jgi:hypothetical protein
MKTIEEKINESAETGMTEEKYHALMDQYGFLRAEEDREGLETYTYGNGILTISAEFNEGREPGVQLYVNKNTQHEFQSMSGMKICVYTAVKEYLHAVYKVNGVITDSPFILGKILGSVKLIADTFNKKVYFGK